MGVETYTEEDLHYLDAVGNSVIKKRDLADLLWSTGKDEAKMDCILHVTSERVNTTLDKQLIHAVEGGGFGAYLTLRNRGMKQEGQETLLYVGEPQELSPWQERKLAQLDALIKEI